MRSRALCLPLQLLAFGLALGGCGSETADSASDPTASQSTPSDPVLTTSPTSPTTEAVPDWPACDSVWKGGATLKRSYRGCLDSEEPVKADRILCSFGTPIVTYAHRFYAQPGHQIHDEGSLKDSAEFQHDIDICTG